VADECQSTTLILIRHGQARSSDGSYDHETPLSDLGRRQADAVAVRLASEPSFAAVYTSPYARAVQTALPLCDKLGIEPNVDQRLREFELGEMSVPEFVESRPDLLVWQPDHKGKPDGGTLGEFAARLAGFAGEIAERHLGERVVIVAHAGTIDAVIRWAIGLPASSPWQHEVDLANGSITEIEYWPRGRVPGGAPRYAVLVRVGDTAHLGEYASDL
jgi:probable phosphoglycerate mutase